MYVKLRVILWKYGNSAVNEKFRGSARNSVACGKVWFLNMTRRKYPRDQERNRKLIITTSSVKHWEHILLHLEMLLCTKCKQKLTSVTV